ncbi:MAG: hypothetical protein U1E60_09525 [Reyranellaceae bacterium]
MSRSSVGASPVSSSGYGFAGELLPINRHQQEILGLQGLPLDCREAAVGLDVAILAVLRTPQQNLMEAADAVGCCVIISTGFAEMDIAPTGRRPSSISPPAAACASSVRRTAWA